MGAASISFKFADSPVGQLILGGTDRGCCLIEFVDRGGIPKIKSEIRKRYKLDLEEGHSPLLDTVENELTDYFSGNLRRFSFPMHLEGTEFERAVWKQLLAIPYGETRTYGEIAALVRSPLAYQAVGRANGQNPLAIAVPCHRVLQKGGGMCGYGGGIWRKEYLLELENGAKQ